MAGGETLTTFDAAPSPSLVSVLTPKQKKKAAKQAKKQAAKQAKQDKKAAKKEAKEEKKAAKAQAKATDMLAAATSDLGAANAFLGGATPQPTPVVYSQPTSPAKVPSMLIGGVLLGAAFLFLRKRKKKASR